MMPRPWERDLLCAVLAVMIAAIIAALLKALRNLNPAA